MTARAKAAKKSRTPITTPVMSPPPSPLEPRDAGSPTGPEGLEDVDVEVVVLDGFGDVALDVAERTKVDADARSFSGAAMFCILYLRETNKVASTSIVKPSSADRYIRDLRAEGYRIHCLDRFCTRVTCLLQSSKTMCQLHFNTIIESTHE
jgi:hypothetical protein